MNIHLRLAEPFWRPTGKREHLLQITESSTAGDLLACLVEQFPELSQEFQETPPRIFRGEEEITIEAELKDDQRIHLVWPLAGG